MSETITNQILAGRRLYVAYGRYMSFAEMTKLCQQAEHLGAGEILHWYLTIQGNSMENIIPCCGARVPAAIWGITIADEMELDAVFNYRFTYTKIEMRVEYNGEIYSGYTYVLNSLLPISAPSKELKLIMQEGYSDNGFSASKWDSRFF